MFKLNTKLQKETDRKYSEVSLYVWIYSCLKKTKFFLNGTNWETNIFHGKRYREKHDMLLSTVYFTIAYRSFTMYYVLTIDK